MNRFDEKHHPGRSIALTVSLLAGARAAAPAQIRITIDHNTGAGRPAIQIPARAFAVERRMLRRMRMLTLVDGQLDSKWR